MSNEIPRRACIDRYTPAETAIREAMLRVEEMGCDVKLTEGRDPARQGAQLRGRFRRRCEISMNLGKQIGESEP